MERYAPLGELGTLAGGSFLEKESRVGQSDVPRPMVVIDPAQASLPLPGPLLAGQDHSSGHGLGE